MFHIFSFASMLQPIEEFIAKLLSCLHHTICFQLLYLCFDFLHGRLRVFSRHRHHPFLIIGQRSHLIGFRSVAESGGHDLIPADLFACIGSFSIVVTAFFPTSREGSGATYLVHGTSAMLFFYLTTIAMCCFCFASERNRLYSRHCLLLRH